MKSQNKCHQNNLIIAVQWKKKGAIGGMAQRMLLLAAHLHDKGQPFICLTSASLACHLGVHLRHPALIAINDSKHILWRSLVACLGIFFQILSGKICSVHFGGGGLFEKNLFRLSSFFVKVSCTFASKSLEMATYGDACATNEWVSLLNISDKIDVLNPTHTLSPWAHKIQVSPNSFPARWYTLQNKPLLPPTKDLLCVFSGALENTKNPLFALEIFECMLTLHPTLRNKAKLILFGNGSLLPQIQIRLQKINHQLGHPSVTIGKSEDYFPTLARASVFFSLQDYDNYPSQSLMEAMLCGCKILATDSGDTSLMFPEGSSNKLITKDTPPVLAAQDLMTLLQDRSVCEENRIHILTHHTLARYALYFEKFITTQSK